MFPSLASLLGTRPWRKDRMLGGSRKKNEAVKLPAVREACSGSGCRHWQEERAGCAEGGGAVPRSSWGGPGAGDQDSLPPTKIDLRKGL